MRFVIIGNSGSGKSVLAASLSAIHALSSLDLDTIAWVPGTVGVPRDPVEAVADVNRFCTEHQDFVLEGCYADLARAALAFRPTLIFLDADAALCEKHCRQRPFEPHKYAAPEIQDSKLQFLLEWVRGYYTREDSMSRSAHLALFEAYDGPKARFRGEMTVNGAGDIIEGI